MLAASYHARICMIVYADNKLWCACLGPGNRADNHICASTLQGMHEQCTKIAVTFVRVCAGPVLQP